MSSNDARLRGRLDSALLFMSRKPAQLAHLLEWFLPPAVLQELACTSGRRKAGRLQPALAIADVIENHAKLRRNVVTALLSERPDAEPLAETETDELSGVAPERLLASLFEAMSAEHLLDWQRIPPLADRFGEILVAKEDTPNHPPARALTPSNSRHSAAAGPSNPLEKLKKQVRSLRAEKAVLQAALGKEHQRKQELLEQVETARSERRDAQTRAAELKRQLVATSSAEERERLLIEESADARRLQHLAEQKIELLVYERDDLRACLEDLDHFDSLTEEEIPSFRNRPLLEKEVRLAQQLERSGAPFRVLVVGGGEPQFRHQGKLDEYAEIMGFHSHWRMAEYVSWHKEMDRLGTDMNTRFDALVILHWNRTTFTRKAREICNQAGHKPCITCYYEGFTSLRETLQECLRQLLATRT
jgi:hypothetical protein